MADLLEVAAVKIKGTQDRRPLVHLRQSRPTDRRQPDARHHRQGRQEAPRARRKRPSKLLAFIGDALIVGHNVGFDIGFIEEAHGRRVPRRARAATSTP